MAKKKGGKGKNKAAETTKHVKKAPQHPTKNSSKKAKNAGKSKAPKAEVNTIEPLRMPTITPAYAPFETAAPAVVENTFQEPSGANLTGFEGYKTQVVAEYANAADGLTAPFKGTSEHPLAFSDDDQTATDPIIPEFSVPDGWRIDIDFELPLLIFTRGDIELFTLPLTENFLENLLPRLNQLHLSQTEAATSWEIRLPEDFKNNPPVFSMVKNGAVAASIPLSQEVIQDLMPALEQFDTREEKVPEKRTKRLRRWVRKYRIRAGLLLIVLIPVTGYLLYAIGMQIFFTPS